MRAHPGVDVVAPDPTPEPPPVVLPSGVAGTVRPCTAASQAGWLELRNQLWPHPDTAVHLAEMESFCLHPERYAQFLFVLGDGAAVGLIELAIRTDDVHGASSSPVAYVEGLFVAPSHRRLGIARALMQRAEAWATAQGLREMASDAVLDNTASHRMHRSLGFRESDRIVCFIKAMT